MYILGFNCYGHDAAAALVKDGELVGFVEEERFLRRKHVPDFPINSMRWANTRCLGVGGNAGKSGKRGSR